MNDKEKAHVVGEEKCPEPGCDGAGNNVKLYSDGSKFCFGCYRVPFSLGNEEARKFIHGEYLPLTTRAITEETARFCDIQVAQYTGQFGRGGNTRFANNEHVIVFNYKISGKVITQKIRTQHKEMTIKGNGGPEMPLYMADKWAPNKKLFVVVNEGEIDTASCIQLFDYQYPVVSIPKGAGNAKSALSQHLRYLLGFKYVVLCFDMDEAGQAATDACVALFEPGMVRVASLPMIDGKQYKDANEMLVDGKTKALKDAIFFAKDVVPKSVVSVRDIINKGMQQPGYGVEFLWEPLTKATYGCRLGEIYVIAGAPATGKTEFITHIMGGLMNQGMKIGLASFEQDPEESLLRIIASRLNRKLHLPGETWDETEIVAEAERLDNKIHFYDRAGQVDVDDMFNYMRYLAKAYSYQIFVVDNLKAIGLANDSEKATYFMNKLKSLMKELNTTVFLLSHVSKNDIKRTTYTSTSPRDPEKYANQTAESIQSMVNRPGLDWDTGRIPTSADIEGSNVVVSLANFVIALGRNRHSQDSTEKRTLNVKFIKARFDSQYDGFKFKLYYEDNGTYSVTNSSDLYAIKGAPF